MARKSRKQIQVVDHIPTEYPMTVGYPLTAFPSVDPWKYWSLSSAAKTRRCFLARQSICTLHVHARNNHL